MKKSLLFIFLLSISSSRAVSEKNTQQTKLKEEKPSIGKESQKTWNVIRGGILFLLVVAVLSITIKKINIKIERDSKALLQACKESNQARVKYLMESSWADVNAKDKNGYPILHLLAFSRKIEMIKLLLKNDKIDVNARDRDGYSILHLLASRGEIEMFELLLEHDKIDVNARDILGEYPLSYACEKGQAEIVKLLLDHKQIDKSYHYLNVACMRDQTKIFKVLFNHRNVDVNKKDIFGQTTLHFASWKGKRDFVRLLVEHKDIKIDTKNREGKTALDIAKDKLKEEQEQEQVTKYKDIISILEEKKKSQET